MTDREKRMKQYKVLVTGACGYIGRHVVAELLRQGHRVIASDFSNLGLPEGVEFTDYPIFDGSPDIYDKLGRPDALIHLAWKHGWAPVFPSVICCGPIRFPRCG